MEYFLLAAIAAAIAGMFLFFRHRSPYTDESFDPTVSMEAWYDNFPDTLIMETRQSHFKGKAPRAP
jgi:hypothetical protein